MLHAELLVAVDRRLVVDLVLDRDDHGVLRCVVVVGEGSEFPAECVGQTEPQGHLDRAVSVGERVDGARRQLGER